MASCGTRSISRSSAGCSGAAVSERRRAGCCLRSCRVPPVDAIADRVGRARRGAATVRPRSARAAGRPPRQSSRRAFSRPRLVLLSHVFADSWRLWICYFADSASAERRMAGTMEPLAQSSEARFADYVDALTTVMGRGDRAGPLKDYCVGLLMPGERKSVEPMAVVVAPARVSAKHQSLLHLVGQAAWSDEAVLAKVRELVLPAIEAQGKIEAWIVDDTGFAKKGVHSVGVARQYCGRLGKTDNCQIAVTLSIANHAASLPIAYQLYLPQDWAGDEARR